MLHAFRLKPGQDLRTEIVSYVKNRDIAAAAVLTCVGSVFEGRLRLAGATETKRFPGTLEIVSLVGTVGVDGAHLHASFSDAAGVVVGGHLVEGNPVYTTAEVVLVELLEYEFGRVLDPATGYPELEVRRK